jgi:hypothetical protein
LRRRRAVARFSAGEVTGALEDAELGTRLEPGNTAMQSVLAMVLARTGDTTRARALIERSAGHYDQSWAGAALLALGDTAAALDRLEHEQPDPGLWSWLQRPQFDALRGNPRFDRLVAASRPPGALGP